MPDYGFQRYGDFRPTAFDTNIDIDREEWYVMPVDQNRDSDILTKSNFACFLKGLGGESRFVEVHRFGHWGPGWFEIILVSPTAKKTLEKAYDMVSSLQDYPILDESDFSERESEDEAESWRNYGARDFRKLLEKELEGELAEDDIKEPVDPRQRWCKNSGMDVDVCCCGDCIETREEWIIELQAKLDEFDNDDLLTLAHQLDMQVEHHTDGCYFTHRTKQWNRTEIVELIDQYRIPEKTKV